MDVLQAVILGIVQGIGEFLPISSSGHLVIVGELLDPPWDSSAKLLMNVTLHVGTLLSILIVYQREILRLRLQPRVCLLLVLASIPAAAVGFTLKDFFERVFETPLIAGVALFGTAGLLVVGQRLEKNVLAYEQLTLGQSLLIGLFQAFALIPGISRSGSTISGGLICGLKRDAAAAFSFLMAVPVIGGAAVLELKDLITGDSAVSQDFVTALLAGGVTSFVVGLFTLRWLISLIARGQLHWFAFYCAAVGTATVIWQLAAAVSTEAAAI
ncbi:undecaprenyl-diphosphate phosphatase [bacterium]|nr:undecaprenyl-diphosphate phosphatase [bacterium]